MKQKYIRILNLAVILLFTLGLAACESSTVLSSYSYYYDTEEVKGSSDSTAVENDSEESLVIETDDDYDLPDESFTIPGGKTSKTPSSSGTVYVPRILNWHGKDFVIMREWEAYPNGKNAAWDNFNAWIEKCEKRYNVNVVEKKWKVPLEAEFLAGVKPEGHVYLINPGGGYVYDMAIKGYLAYFDDAMKETGIDMTEDRFNQYSTQITNFDGKQYGAGIGFARVNGAVVYNKKILAELGYEKTAEKDNSIRSLMDAGKWTWSKMTEIAKAATLRDGVGNITRWGIGIGEEGIKSMIISNNGNLVSPNSKGKFVSHIKDANTVAALEQVYNWYHTDRVASAFENESGNSRVQKFVNGEVAMLFVDQDDIPLLYEKLTVDDYRLAYLPRGPKSKSNISYLASNYVYVTPVSYQDMTTEILLLINELHDWPVEGYVWDDQFRDEWTRYFHIADQYKVWYDIHYAKNVTGKWEASDYLTFDGFDFESLFKGTKTPEQWAEAADKNYSSYYKTTASKYNFTGKFK